MPPITAEPRITEDQTAEMQAKCTFCHATPINVHDHKEGMCHVCAHDYRQMMIAATTIHAAKHGKLYC